MNALGFEVLEVSNSAVASREPVAKRPATDTLPHWGRATIAAGAGSVQLALAVPAAQV